jgi:RimJ/RimL family protein N-acetyltransferase
MFCPSYGREPIFSIVRIDTDELIGRCLLFSVDRVNRSAMLGIVIGEKRCWNQGYGQEALILLLDYAFNLLNLNSVMLGVFAFNQRAVASYRKVGFQEIGRRRQARILGGKAYDAILMDILTEEFTARYPSRTLEGRISQPLP